MGIKVLYIGILLFVFAIIGFVESPDIINKTLGSFITKDSPAGTETLLKQMGFPSIETITQTAEYSSMAMYIAGISMIFLGGLAKNKETKNARQN